MQSVKITLLSLAGSSYKYLADTGAFDSTTSALLEDGTVLIKHGAEIGHASAEILKDICIKDNKSIYPIAALGTAVGLWFIFDSIIEYDENGAVQFRIPILTDRYIDA